MPIARYLPRFREAARDIGILEQRESWSRQQIEELQLDRLNRLWAHASVHVPYYAKLTSELKLPERFAALEEFSRSVPVLPKPMVRDGKAQLLSAQRRPGLWKYTSGTTGRPNSIYWSREAHQEALRAKYRFHAQWGVDIFDRIVWLWGPGVSQKPGFKGWWSRFRQPHLDRMRNRLRLLATTLDKDHVRQYLVKIQDFEPSMIYGFSRALHLLALQAEGAGFRCPSLKVIVASSECIFPHMIERITRTLGAPVAREYGSQECGMIAMDDRDQQLRVREDQLMVETLPRADGQYDLIVTPLNNPSFPLLRYAIGDITDSPLLKPQRGMAVLSSVGGREHDLLRTPNGEYLHWVQLENMVAKTSESVVRRFTMDQRADGSVEVEVELDDPSRAGEIAPKLAALKELLTQRLGGYDVNVRTVDCVRQTETGKHRVITSALCDLGKSPNTK
jgi:phenylacetate-CoA ligase